MPRQKREPKPRVNASQAVYYHVRFNPKTSEEDREVLKVIQELEATKKWNFHKIVVDAILQNANYTPGMFAVSSTPDIAGLLEESLAKFAAELLTEIRKGGTSGRELSDDDSGETSAFASNLARTFMERQRRGLGDDE